jgi:O-antigen/teichoic acid export membrane protein
MISPYTLVYLVAHIVPAIIGFAALILYTHLLSPAEYGIYVVGASVAGVISAVFFVWVRLSVSRYQARSPELDLRAEAVVSYIGSVALVGCLTPTVIFFAWPKVGAGFVVATLLLSLSVNAFEIGQEFRRAQLNPLRFLSIAMLRSLMALTLGYGAIELGFGGLGLLTAMGVSYLITNILSYQGSTSRPRQFFSPTHLSQFVRYGLPLSLGALACALHNVLDRLGVAYLLGESGAGYYGLAADMTRQVVGILAASVASAMFPIAFRTFAESGAVATRARLNEGIELLLALIAPVAVWLAISADVVAGTLLGAEFQSSVATLLPFLVFGRMCGAINQWYLHVSFQLVEKPLLQVAHDSFTLLINLVLLFPLTLTFGLPGTAAAVLIAEAAGILIGIGLSRRAFPLPFNGWGMARVFGSAAIMGAVTYVAKLASSGHGVLSLLTVMIAGGLAYGAAVLVFDVASIRSSIRSYLRPRWVAAE